MNKLLYTALSIGLSTQLLFATSSQALTSGKAIDGAVKQQEKKYYNIIVPKNKSVRVNVTGLEADVDLYVKKGNEVRLRFNDCYSSNSNTEDEECIVTNEGETSTYSILVNGFKASSFNLKATVDGAEEIPTLTSEPIADAVAQKEGKQYRVEGKKGETITVTLSGLTADADLRVRVGRKASLHSFNCKSNNSGKKTEECVITPKKDATVYVHVYGYKAAGYRVNAVNYELINLAKKSCINNNIGTNIIACLPKKIAFTNINEDNHNGDFTAYLYRIDINSETIKLIDEEYYPIEYLPKLINLKGFPAVAISSDFKFSEKSWLIFRNSNGEHQKSLNLIYTLIKEIKTLENNKKLSIKYEADKGEERGPVLYENIYEMISPLEMKLISEEKL